MKKIFYVLLAVATLFILQKVFLPYTAPVLGTDPIFELREVELNGDTQWILIRGQDKKNPILLFLHGGPGMPAMYLAHSFQRPLEQDFVVVHWDQRASGKSFPDEGYQGPQLTTRLLINDLRELINVLKEDYPDQPIILVGHSHGSYLGAIYSKEYPETIDAFVGVGQVADETKTIPLQDAFIEKWQKENGQEFTEVTGATRESWLFKSGAEIYGETSFIPLVIEGLKAEEYSFGDILKVQRGSRFSSTNMQRDMIDGALMKSVTDFSLPVYFVMGRHDMVTPVSLAQAYFDSISAPEKEFFLLEKAAHFPFYSQPDEFAAILLGVRDRLDQR